VPTGLRPRQPMGKGALSPSGMPRTPLLLRLISTDVKAGRELTP